MKPLVAVIGPTAVGKTRLALHLARHFNGEIVNADSRQVYRFMDIGTAKPSKADRVAIPHHLIDIVNPDEPFSLALYREMSNRVINDMHQRSKLPLLVGGSGLYVWSLLEGWLIPEVPPDLEFRRHWEIIATEKGVNLVYKELQNIDPIAATKIMPTNLRRIIRALEIYHATGQLPSETWKKQPPPFDTKVIGLTADRGILYRKIDLRVDEMITNGLVNEVKNLIASGYNLGLPSMSGIGYHQIGQFLQGIMTLPDAIQRIKYETHKFARRQYAWFHLNDARICWFDVCGNIEKPVDNLVKNFINSVS